MLEKSKKLNNEQHVINEHIQIHYPKVRVLNVNGIQLGIFSSHEAIKIAFQEGLDLVMISDKPSPPVCLITDYGKYKFIKDKRAKEARKKQHNASLKEVKMRYKIEEHDYKVRINQASRFLQAGDKVKATITFRGREIQHTDLAINLLQKMAKDLNKQSNIQQPPSKDGRHIIMILSPKKSK